MNESFELECILNYLSHCVIYGDVYSAHSHAFEKVIYVLRGTITIGLPEFGEYITLNEGDRLDLPAGVIHDAVGGPQGVICLEAHMV